MNLVASLNLHSESFVCYKACYKDINNAKIAVLKLSKILSCISCWHMIYELCVLREFYIAGVL